MAKKVTKIILRVAGMPPAEFTKPGDWSKQQIKEFVKGLKSGHPGAVVDVSKVRE